MKGRADIAYSLVLFVLFIYRRVCVCVCESCERLFLERREKYFGFSICSMKDRSNNKTGEVCRECVYDIVGFMCNNCAALMYTHIYFICCIYLVVLKKLLEATKLVHNKLKAEIYFKAYNFEFYMTFVHTEV